MADYTPLTPRPPMFGARFLDKNETVAGARKIYLKAFLGGAFLVSLVIFSVFSIYWGAIWKSPAHNLSGWIVDFDQGRIGQTVTQGLTQGASRITWTNVPASLFPNGSSQVIQSLVEEKAWVIVSINSGATLRLNDSLSALDGAYNGSSAVTAYAIEARNENAFRTIVRPSVQALLDTISANFALQFAREVSSSSTNLTAILSTSPQVITAPISYTLQNVIPFDVPLASVVTFVGLIFLLILSFFIVLIGNGAREAANLPRLLTLSSLIYVRMISMFTTTFILSLFYSLLSRAFQLPFSRKFGHSGFLVFWMLSWVGMLSVGLALEALMPLLTPRLLPMFMVFWILTNIAVCTLPIEVLPKLYHYGYATPFYNISKSVRTIIFGTRNHLSLNFGVLLVWVSISCVTLPLIQWIVRRRDERNAVKQGKEISQLMRAQSHHTSKGITPPIPQFVTESYYSPELIQFLRERGLIEPSDSLQLRTMDSQLTL